MRQDSMGEGKRDTSIRVSAQTYSRLVKARGLLETIQNRRLSLDEAASVSARFAYVVADFLIDQVAENRILGGAVEDESFRFLPPENLRKLAPKLVEDFMRLTE